ncbi:DUF3906 family protein [Neobacillus sp. LXY-4]|uniref:DUF3906 family protein n=1 Tax=Neobacillus sp. LXY-4 TaxID=3379826 RepID=UPI003EDF9C95
MNLYRFEVTLGREVAHVIVAADNEEAAFNQVDIEIERHFLKLPVVNDVVLYEKKVIRNGAGFVITRDETII